MYRLNNFEVIKNSAGKYEIVKHEAFYTTNAYIINDNIFLWNEAPFFNSYIKAVKFLKENINNLI